MAEVSGYAPQADLSLVGVSRDDQGYRARYSQWMRPWRQEGEHLPYLPPDQDTWDRLRADLTLGQQISGTVAWAPRPGAIGLGVDLGLPVGGFVDVLLLPRDHTKWPAQGTAAEFKIWWMDERPQIRLVPVASAHRREDFDTWILAQTTPAATAFHENP